jgi:hypothetical protein
MEKINEKIVIEMIEKIVEREMEKQGILRFIREITHKTAIAEVRKMKKNGNKL